MKKLWHTLTHIGISDDLDSRESRRVSHVNCIALMSTIYLTTRILLSLPNIIYCLKLFSMNIFVVLVLVLNHYHCYRAAKIITFSAWVASIAFFTYLYLGGFSGGAYVTLFAAVPWPFMLFDHKQDRPTIVALLGGLLLCFALLFTLHNIRPLPVTVDLDMETVRISTTVLTIVFLLMQTWYFHSMNQVVEATLRLEKDKSEKANKQLHQEIIERERAEKELRASEHQMRLITDNTPAYIAYVGADDLRYWFVNRRFEEAYSLPREKIIGRHIKEIISEENYRFALPSIEKVKAGQTVSYENVFLNADGRRWIQVNYVPDFDQQGTVRAIVVMSHDITDLKNTQEQYKNLYKIAKETEERYHSLLNSTPDAIVIYSIEGRVTYINKAFTDMFGRYLEEIENGIPYVPESERNVTMQNVEKVIQDGLSLKDFETRRLTAKGKLVDVSISASRFNDHLGKPAGMLVILRDITQHKNSEKLLRQAKEAAEAANRAKSAFLANMSHELRTPLNAILGFSELMRRAPDISKEQQQNLETIGRSGEHLLSLINDVLEFSKIEAGRIVLNKEDFDLHRLLILLEEMFRLRARQKGITLEFACDPEVPQYIHADQNKLRQIMINLLGNALKFTETGGVRLSVKCTPSQSEEPGRSKLHFEVADTGCGISSQEQLRIFDAFYQSESPSSTQQGTGLGLPISRKFAELMDGVLVVDSEVGKGTCFTLAITLEPAESETAASHQLCRRVVGLAAGQTTFRLLVVEDNDNNRNLLVTLLKSVGFEVQEAVNGKMAIEIWRQWRPHLIWMDIRMPAMDGFDAMATIRSEMQQTNSDIDTKMIAITASAFEEDRLKVFEYGGNDFVRKPFRESEIFEMISKHLGVSYVFEQEEGLITAASRTVDQTDDKLAASLMELPADLLARLKEATELSDAAGIERVIREVFSKDEELAEVLSKLATNFAYDRILTLIQRPEQTDVGRQAT